MLPNGSGCSSQEDLHRRTFITPYPPVFGAVVEREPAPLPGPERRQRIREAAANASALDRSCGLCDSGGVREWSLEQPALLFDLSAGGASLEVVVHETHGLHE